MTQAIAFTSPKMGHVKRVHCVGIGGSGMCGIAEVLHNEGYQVTGSDIQESRTVSYLRALGLKLFMGHQAEYIQGADVVVRSSAIPDDNPEIQAALQDQIPVIPRAMMLAELMRFRYGIAIAGTHGKTTTTSLVTSILQAGGLDPTFVIGGKLTSCGSNAQHGHSPYFVAEADESDASFLFLKPMITVVTNIDADHMSTYQGSFAKLKSTFLEFLHHLPFYGLAVLCVDDPEVRHILAKVQRPTLTYGFRKEAQYRAVDWHQHGLTSQFTVLRPAPYASLSISFQSPGRHNVQNALAAIAIATELGVADTAIQQALASFQGVGRRFQLLGERQFLKGRALVIDDYGHHPQEIRATLDACRAVWPKRRLIHVFQPHRYSRTQELFSQFVDVLTLADQVLLFDIYPAGESPIQGIDSSSLAHAVELNNHQVTLVSPTSLLSVLDTMVEDDDIILMQGAGSISQYAYQLLES